MTISPFYFNALKKVDAWAYANDRIRSWDHDSPYTLKTKLLREVASRIGYIALIPFGLVSAAIDGSIGFVLGAVSLISFGKLLDKRANAHLYAFTPVVSATIECALRILNPRAFIHTYFEKEQMQMYWGGYLARKLIQESSLLTYELTTSNHLLVKHVVSRCVPLLSIPLTCLAVTADFAISTCLLPALILTLGT